MSLFKLIFCILIALTINSVLCITPFPVGTTWDLQYSGKIDLSHNVMAYDLDLFDTSKSVIDDLHKRGIKMICYFSAGSYQNWRPDAKQFPKEVLGKNLDGWEGQKWLDVRAIDKLAPIMTNRIKMAADKGCDAVDPDNMDGYTQDSGFKITAADQLKYNRWIANLAHEYKMAVGLKNDVDQIKDLVSSYDFAVNEQCFQYNECEKYGPFSSANKAIFNVQYKLATSTFCPKAKAMRFSSIRKKLELDQYVEFCDNIKNQLTQH